MENTTIADLIYLKRVNLKMTQEELAKEVGVNRSFISKVENGVKKPSMDLTIKIAKALDLDLNDLK